MAGSAGFVFSQGADPFYGEDPRQTTCFSELERTYDDVVALFGVRPPCLFELHPVAGTSPDNARIRRLSPFFVRLPHRSCIYAPPAACIMLSASASVVAGDRPAKCPVFE